MLPSDVAGASRRYAKGVEMQMFKRALVAMGAMAAMGAANAAVIIDLFTDPSDAAQHKVSVTKAGGNGSSDFDEYEGQVLPASILGNYRDLYVELVSSTNSDSSSGATLSAGGGGLNFSSASQTTAFGVVQWDGADNSSALTNGLNVDLKNCAGQTCDRFTALVTDADLAFAYEITVLDKDGTRVKLSSSSQFSVGSDPGDTPPPVSADFLFSWFNLGTGLHFDGGLPFYITVEDAGATAGVNFEQIGALQLSVNTTVPGLIDYAGNPVVQKARIDLGLSSINVVPEPGSLGLVGAALFAASFVARSRRKA